ncbi:MAG: hypothetical protein KGD60_07760 [Candidatus Thorarchaeota archaeon]|nr:hypothetical protein [Candidatus Thorarchaeota archaeon]
MTQAEDVDVRYWGYAESWRSGRTCGDYEVRVVVIEFLKRQRGDSINLRRLVKVLMKRGIQPHIGSLRELLGVLGLVQTGESGRALSESWLIP